MAKKTYILEIVYDDESDELLDFNEFLEADVKRYMVNHVDIGMFFDKEDAEKLEECTDIGIS